MFIDDYENFDLLHLKAKGFLAKERAEAAKLRTVDAVTAELLRRTRRMLLSRICNCSPPRKRYNFPSRLQKGLLSQPQ